MILVKVKIVVEEFEDRAFLEKRYTELLAEILIEKYNSATMDKIIHLLKEVK